MKRIGIFFGVVMLMVSCGDGRKSGASGASGVQGASDTSGVSDASGDGVSREISVSILPQKYFVERLAGDLLDVNVMIPPGASPATYEPSPSQLATLTRSSIYLKMGYSGFEMAWMDKLQAINKDMKVVDLSEGIDLIMEESAHGDGHHHEGHDHGGIDPHIWLSPRNVKVISKNMYHSLKSVYPEYDSVFQVNLHTFLTELDSLDAVISEKMQGLTSNSFYIYHPALSYFSRDYGLQQYPLELGGKEPSAAHMKELIDMGLEKEIGVVFLQMQFDQHNAEVLAKEIGAEVVQINPLDPNWYDQMITISEKLGESLR